MANSSFVDYIRPDWRRFYFLLSESSESINSHAEHIECKLAHSTVITETMVGSFELSLV